MKNLNRYISIIFFSFFCFNPTIADEITAVVNLDLLIKETNVGKKLLKSINDLNENNINQLEKKNKILKELEIEIKNKKNIISKQDFDIEVKNFQQKVQDFTNEKNKIVKDINDFRTKELEKLFKLFNPIISDYMKKNSINILLDVKNTFMVNKVSDLTNDILIEINNKIK